MHISESRLLPRYIKLAKRLQQQINNGLLKPGVKLPAQRELAEQFDTTLMTIRRAVDVLAEQGVVRVEHGVGTFIADPQLQENAFQLLSLSSALRQRSLEAQTEVVQISIDIQHEKASQALGVPTETRLCMLERLRYMNDRPFVMQQSYLGQQLQQIIKDYDSSDSLYDDVQAVTGQAVSHAREYLIPTTLSARQAQLLQADSDQAAWLSVRISSLQDGQPVIYDEAVVRQESLVVTVERNGAIGRSELKWLDDQSPDLMHYLLGD